MKSLSIRFLTVSGYPNILHSSRRDIGKKRALGKVFRISRPAIHNQNLNIPSYHCCFYIVLLFFYSSKAQKSHRAFSSQRTMSFADSEDLNGTNRKSKRLLSFIDNLADVQSSTVEVSYLEFFPQTFCVRMKRLIEVF